MPKTTLYNVRDATENDIFEMTALCLQFCKEIGTYKLLGFDSSKMMKSIESIITSDECLALVLTENDRVEGLFLAIVAPALFSQTLLATELVWYVSPEARGNGSSLSMVERFEVWAKENGAVMCSMFNMQSSDPEKSAAMYGKLGYKMAEATFMKEI
jgi:hypothetical protein